MEPILAKADNYSFLKKLVENVKQTKDAQAPDDDEINKVNRNIQVIPLDNLLSFWAISPELDKFLNSSALRSPVHLHLPLH